MRHFWEFELPVGHATRGAAFGERMDPSTIGIDVPKKERPAAALRGAGTILKFIGNMEAGNAARRQGAAQRAETEFEAAQLHQQAGQQVALSQREALDERRKAALVASRAIAVAAASGGGASDPTIQALVANIAGEGHYRAGMKMYEGAERSRQLETGADAKRYEGQVLEQGARDRQRAYQLAGLGGAVTGAATLFSKYGNGGPRRPSVTSPLDGGWLDAGTEGYTAIG